MAADTLIPNSFWCHPRFDKWRGRQGKESRFMRVMRVLQSNADNPYAVQQCLDLWKENLKGALTSVLDFLREGAKYAIWDWDEAEGRLELAAWVWEESATPQTALPLYEEVRPPSKQPEAVREEKRRNRARLQAAAAYAPVSEAPAAVAAPVVALSVSAASPQDVGSESRQKPSDISAMSEAMSEDVGSEQTAYSLASLAEASLCIHNKAKARALSLAAQITKNAQYPLNQMAPSEKEIHRLLQIGHSAQDVEAAIAKCQDSPTVLSSGGLGEKGWRTWMERKLDTPDAARTQRLDMLVPSEVRSDSAHSPATAKATVSLPSAASAPVPLQNVAYDTQGRAVPISEEAKRTLERNRREQQYAKPLTAMTSDEVRASRLAGLELEKQAQQARDNARKAG